jgi:hypothetical protein
MFSLDRFYHILHDNLISQFMNGKSFYFYPFGSVDKFRMISSQENSELQMRDIEATFTGRDQRSFVHCYYHDQEPIYTAQLPCLDEMLLNRHVHNAPRKIQVFANSEISDIKRQVIKNYGNGTLYDWYYFFHGFAALDWYRDFQYIKPRHYNRTNKVFICLNHLISKYRSYRLHLVSNLMSQDLVKYGNVSLQLEDNIGNWQQAIADSYSPLHTKAKIKIFQTLRYVDKPLIFDREDFSGNLSADVDFDVLTSAMWHVVTETVYFQEKLHLTEKTFKPIVAHRPFILVAAAGNLAYLKRYGFKTFDRWIDESYDQETDNYRRIEKITREIERLCAMSQPELDAMYKEMLPTLEYNFNHFYGDFKKIIVDELVDNFEGVLMQYNNGRMPGNHSRYHQRIELCKEHYTELKQLLLK